MFIFACAVGAHDTLCMRIMQDKYRLTIKYMGIYMIMSIYVHTCI